MTEPLDELYFNWLYAKVMLAEPPAQSYNRLIRELYNTEFVWLLSGDDNRAQDGIDLRSEFISESRLEIDISWFDAGCSVLEMLIAFSRIAEFETDIPSGEWFWQFVSNLGLSNSYDDNYIEEDVAAKLYDFVWRTYEYNGTRGLFPLNDPREDQREVEVWYQFCKYIEELERV